MTARTMNPKVDFYFNKTKKWSEELDYLRVMVLDCGLIEELKWGVPCYSLKKKNIVLIHVFKEYCALLFFKGILLKDEKGILIQQTKNVQSARQIRYTNVEEIISLKPVVKAYIHEAIAVEKAGLKVGLKKSSEYPIAEEFQKKLSAKGGAALKAAFKSLTPGRQRAYLLYFSAAKQPQTRSARVEKSIPAILAGRGLND